MARINKPKEPVRTHEGAKAKRISSEQQLRRSVMSCMLWEDEFYEDGESVVDRIRECIKLVDPEKVGQIAIEARYGMKLRHVPLLIAREMAALDTHKKHVADLLEQIIRRPDELAEFLAIYWKDGKKPISAQVKKGLARAFTKFDAYTLAKWNRDGAIKLRDVLFLCHAKPKDGEQAKVFRQLIDNTLPIPDTWETELSAGKDKKETFERLIKERKLGALALLRNLRNMNSVGVDKTIIIDALERMNTEFVLPFRFVAAAKYAPHLEENLSEAMYRCIECTEMISGKTLLLVDVSGSMDWILSARSEMNRIDAACGLAILAREMCEDVEIMTFSNDLVDIPNRHGFALRDAIMCSQYHGGTDLGGALATVYKVKGKYDRIIVFTDEQSHTIVPDPPSDTKGYMINVASCENGVGYGPWHHIDGFSETVLNYIIELEKEEV